MIRRDKEVRVQERVEAFEGQGTIFFHHLLDGTAELNDKGRLFAKIVIPPGCSIGYHVHKNETEAYYVLSGKGELNDNGLVTEIGAGDVTFTADGEGHSILNIVDEDLELIALILFT